MTDKVKAIVCFVAAVYQLDPGDIPRGTHKAARTVRAQQARDTACWLINVCTNLSSVDIASALRYNESRQVLLRIDACIERRRRGEDIYSRLFDEYVRIACGKERQIEAAALHETPQYADKLVVKVAKRLVELVCQTFDVRKDDLFSKKREYHLIRARFALIWMLRTAHRYTLQSIGEYMDKDHSTIINAIQQFNNMIEQNKRSGYRDTKINVIIEYANRIKQQ